MSKSTTIFAIETSCDETGVAILRKTGDTIEVLSESIASQMDIHAATGGVVPEVAAREHVAVLPTMITKALEEAKVTPKEIDAIAITVGPGLMPALAVGVQAARTLSYVWQKPIVPVHHIEGHIYSALLGSSYKLAADAFPALALIVSGGHTLLIEVKSNLQYKILGSTVDDAAGEAFDKVARLLELPYPGGPAISALAQQGNPTAYDFPRPMLHSKDLHMSFSGLKTAVLYAWRKLSPEEQGKEKANIAASFQQAVVDVLANKTAQAIDTHNPTVILLGGGVAANTQLQQAITKVVQEKNKKIAIAPQTLFGDNATMIGQVGLFAYEAGRQKNWADIDATARINIEEFSV